MRLGIIGLPNCGKTTIFNALTGSNLETAAVSSGQFELHTAVVNVPDPRIYKLTAMYSPKRTIYATITFLDIGGMDKGISQGGLKGQFRNELSQVDGFVHVIRAFNDDTVPHPYITVDPKRDLETIDSEFLLSDLVTVENRLEKLNDELRIKGKKAEQSVQPQIDLMNRLRETLEEERPLRELDDLTEEDLKLLRGYGFLSLKPMIVVLNTGEQPLPAEQQLAYDYKRSAIVQLQGKLEAEIAQLDADGKAMFMEEYNLAELSAATVIRLSYELMSIQSFFTVGEDEVRAWSVAVGSTAPEAAGAIHSDLQKGFIRAEVMGYQELVDAGSEAALKQAGKFRLEGKEYIVKDGDILNIRFQKGVK
ncbi:MAG: redox-regulated ATPase YchF [Armatimonadetes bacterium]|nr:redox-regulated ATPase YchF [Anaerolineae bacterium]